MGGGGNHVRARFSPEAKRDLLRLSSRETFDNAAAARLFRHRLIQQVYRLAALGVVGSSRDYLPEGYTAFPFRGRTFYFRVDGDDLIVVRILHQRESVDDLDLP